MRDNILACYKRATSDEVAEGTAWYQAAHTFARGLSDRYGLTLSQAAGVIAAMSPQQSWDRNMVTADQICRTGECPGVLGLNKRKALAILAGEDVTSVLRCASCKRGDTTSHACTGEKVRQFYACIIDPSDADSVCIDRHAFDIAMGKVGDDTSRKALDRKGTYANIADAYRAAAKKAKVSPSTMQAITWVAWRNATEKERFAQRFGRAA